MNLVVQISMQLFILSILKFPFLYNLISIFSHNLDFQQFFAGILVGIFWSTNISISLYCSRIKTSFTRRTSLSSNVLNDLCTSATTVVNGNPFYLSDFFYDLFSWPFLSSINAGNFSSRSNSGPFASKEAN